MKLRLLRNERKHASEKGQSLVELGIGVVVLFTLIAGTVDFGLAFINFVAMRDAAQEGAVYGSLHPRDCTAIANYARESAESLLTGVEVDVKIDGVSCASAASSLSCVGHTIQVVVSQPHYPITMPFVGSILPTPNELNLRAEINDTILAPKCP